MRPLPIIRYTWVTNIKDRSIYMYVFYTEREKVIFKLCRGIGQMDINKGKFSQMSLVDDPYSHIHILLHVKVKFYFHPSRNSTWSGYKDTDFYILRDRTYCLQINRL